MVVPTLLNVIRIDIKRFLTSFPSLLVNYNCTHPLLTDLLDKRNQSWLFVTDVPRLPVSAVGPGWSSIRLDWMTNLNSLCPTCDYIMKYLLTSSTLHTFSKEADTVLISASTLVSS